MQDHRPHARRRPTIALLVVLLTLMLMAGAALLNRDFVLQHALQALLRNYGVTLQAVTGLQWDTRSAQIQSLQVMLPGATTPTRIENLRVNYALPELLRGRVQRIQIDRVDLHLAASTQSTSMPPAESIAATLAVLQALPAFSADIATLHIAPWALASSLSARTDEREFQAQWRAADLLLDWRSNWHDEAFVSSHFIPETSLLERGPRPAAHTASLQLQHGSRQVLRADLTIHATDSGLLLDGSAQMSLAPLHEALQASGIVSEFTAGLAGEADLRVQATLPQDTDLPVPLALTVQATHGTWNRQGASVDWRLDALNLEGECQPQGDCRFSQSLAGVLKASSGQPLAATLPELALPGGVMATQIQVETRGTLAWATGHWVLDSPEILLHLPQLRVEDREFGAKVTLTALQASGESSPLRLAQLETAVRLDDVQGLTLPYAMPPPTLSATLRWDGSRLTSHSTLALAERLALQGELAFDTTEGQGRAQVQLPATRFDADNARLSTLLQASGLPGDILAGSVAAQSQLSLSRNATGSLQVSGPLEIQLDGLGGFVGDTAIAGLSTRFRGELDGNRLRSDGLAALSIDSVDPGISLQNVKTDIALDMEAGRLQLAGLSLDVFGGRVLSAGGDLALDGSDGMLELQLERIDVERILALGAYEGVQASGLLSGTLPVRLDATGISVAAGALHAETPGGSIRYTGGTGTGNSAVDFVNTTLNNYRYDVLDASVNYLPEGELSLAIQMQGVNPDNNPEQRINLNLNISDNIPALLRSLQAGRSVTEAVEAYLQAR
jgi:hypothetical protein